MRSKWLDCYTSVQRLKPGCFCTHKLGIFSVWITTQHATQNVSTKSVNYALVKLHAEDHYKLCVITQLIIIKSQMICV